MKAIKVATASIEAWLEKTGWVCFEVLGSKNGSILAINQPGKDDYVYTCRRCGKKIGRESGQYPIHPRFVD